MNYLPVKILHFHIITINHQQFFYSSRGQVLQAARPHATRAYYCYFRAVDQVLLVLELIEKLLPIVSIHPFI